MRGKGQLVAVTAAALAAAPMLAGCGGASPSTGGSSTPTGSGGTTSTSTPATPSRTPTPTGSPASNSLSRSHPAHLELVRAHQLDTKGRCRAAPKRGQVCAPGGTSYRFDPGTVQRVEVMQAGVEHGQQSSDRAVVLSLAPSGSRALAELTRSAVNTHESAVLTLPGSRRVLVAAQVMTPILDGNLQLTGQYDKAKANAFVRLVTATAD